ncbi:MAG: hypothetical protein U9P10_11525 [Thermodesulfobacteriota bacterium]|nr:hypothetical protein [Thermodesulfobacteriota bacterium]
MEAIRQIVDLNKLESVINIPKGFNSTKVEVIIFPADDFIPKEKEKRNFGPYEGKGSFKMHSDFAMTVLAGSDPDKFVFIEDII